MIKNKIAISFLASALLFTTGATLTQAATPAVYTVCTVSGCNITGNHDHNGSMYGGHSIGDGHDYHLLCNSSNCTLTGVHDHNSVTYLGHHTNTGYTTSNSTGRHHRGGRHH